MSRIVFLPGFDGDVSLRAEFVAELPRRNEVRTVAYPNRPLGSLDAYRVLAMGELPVTIRTLDPPLHEFLPHGEVEQRGLAQAMGISEKAVAAMVEHLQQVFERANIGQTKRAERNLSQILARYA